jgi:hypothetical protein
MKIFRLYLFTLCLLAGPLGCSKYPPYEDDAVKLIGQWGIDNNYSRRADEMPEIEHLAIFPDHASYAPGQGTYYLAGSWHDNGFWYRGKDGSEVEAVKVTAPEFVEVHVAAFIVGNSQVITLYKEKGSPAEMQAVAAKFSTPLPNPPPSGTITVGMTEFQVRSLPWKPSKILNAVDWNYISETGGGTPDTGARDQDAMILCYRCDDPRLAELRVTIKDHKVIAVGGGNG